MTLLRKLIHAAAAPKNEIKNYDLFGFGSTDMLLVLRDRPGLVSL